MPEWGNKYLLDSYCVPDVSPGPREPNSDQDNVPALKTAAVHNSRRCHLCPCVCEWHPRSAVHSLHGPQWGVASLGQTPLIPLGGKWTELRARSRSRAIHSFTAGCSILPDCSPKALYPFSLLLVDGKCAVFNRNSSALSVNICFFQKLANWVSSQ